jgi:hypothetical protein
MRSGLTFNITSEPEMAVETEGPQHWLAALEALSIRTVFYILFDAGSSDTLTAETKTARKHFALQIIDILRTMQTPLSADQLNRLFTIVVALDVSVFPVLLNPSYQDKLIYGKRCNLHLISLFSVLSTCHESISHL